MTKLTILIPLERAKPWRALHLILFIKLEASDFLVTSSPWLTPLVIHRFNMPPKIKDAAALAPTLKRPRIAWTPQLHKRFVDVVSHLGLKDAAPKAIMRLMNVDGLTRENVASHLQKYRLYLKRTQVSNDEALVPMPASQNSLHSSPSADFHGNGYFATTFPMSYMPSPMMPMMFYGMGAHGHTDMPIVNTSTVSTTKGEQD